MKQGSWRTTTWGVATILAALASGTIALADGDPDTSADLMSVVAAVSAGLGLIVARDNRVSSEAAGAK